MFAGGAEALYYVHFRAAVPKVKPLCEEIEKRATAKEYATILEDCQVCECERQNLLCTLCVFVCVLRLFVQCHLSPLALSLCSVCTMLFSLPVKTCHLFRLLDLLLPAEAVTPSVNLIR